MPEFSAALHPTPFAGPAAGAGALPPEHRIPGFPTPAQEKTNWCWAAVTSALLSRQSGNQWSQTSVANFWGTAEDVTISLGELLSRLWQSGQLVRYGSEGRTYLQNKGNIQQEMRSLLDRDIPIPLTVSWNGSLTNHYVCAFGYGSLAGSFALWIFDPSAADSCQDNKRLLPIEEVYAYRSNAGSTILRGEWSQIFLPYDG
jgi:hypothetical protein